MKQMTAKIAYAMLAASIVFEQAGTAFLAAADGFTKWLPTLGMIAAYLVCYWCFAQALRHINLSISYATWTALGTVSAAIVGWIAFHQVISPVGWLAIAIMCAGIFILNLSGDEKEGEA